MSSPLSDAFKDALNKKVNDIEAKSKNRVEIAMERTEERVREKIQEIIEEYALNFYYEGYTPKWYQRKYQLPKAIWPAIEEFKRNGAIGFRYGANFDEDRMHHKVSGRKREAWDDEYEGGLEKYILDNFREGIHPNTGVDQGPIWVTGMMGAAPDALRQWKNSGAIKNIFMEEFRRLLK